jgi:hypothetical protein
VGRVDLVLQPVRDFFRSLLPFLFGGFFSSFWWEKTRKSTLKEAAAASVPLFLTSSLTISGKALAQSEALGLPS